MSTLYFKSGGKISKSISCDENIFCYLVRVEMKVNDTEVNYRHLVEFENNGIEISFEASEDWILILGQVPPVNEAMFTQGPLISNIE